MNTQHLSVVVDVQGKIENFKAAASEMQQYLDKLKLPAMQENQAANLFGRIAQEIEKIQGLTAKGNITPIDSKKIQEAEHNLANLFGQLELFSKSPAVSGAATKQMVAGWNEATQAVHEYVNALKEINRRKPTKSSTQMESRLGEYTSKVDTTKATLLDRAQAKMVKLDEKREAALSKAYETAFKSYLEKHPDSWYKNKTATEWRQNATKAEQDQIEGDLKKSSPDYTKTIQQLEQVKALIAEVNNGLTPSAENSSGLTKEAEAYKKATEAAKQYQSSIESAKNSESNIAAEATQGLEKLRQELSKIKGVNWKEFLPDGKDLNTATFEEITQAVQKFQESLNQTGKNSPQLEAFFKKISGAAGSLVGDLNNAGEALDRLSERQKNASQTLSYLQYAFSTISVFRLFRRAINSVHDAVKELDAAMMETAVVTKYTISDLWKKLPEYTERANRLGVSTLGAYQSATLYYQQGLNDKQVGAISEETLKMARIASLDYADATNYMTAALRGFNMELNNTSAEHVNDVYNRLAAMTAADTAGIATAMTKTASIAKSAGIEFEQMAAFLAQIIETTQESPETAGTAMKTVIARFSEVKKLYTEGEILGSDEEGEEINVNKIQEALRKVGISMTGFFTGTQGLGDILIELASKWDSLDVATQRYIATTAAGSRQQSRFIALMQDYSRTQELVGAAYDSQGASQSQFEKTLDSLDAKTQRLTNAWNEFLLDLANSDVIKSVVDLLNGVVKAINTITGALGSGGSGIAKLLLGLGVLKAGRSLLGGMGYMMNPSTLKDYGGNRLTAFRAGAASSMGLRDYDAKSGKSVIGAAYNQNIHQPHQALRQGIKDGSIFHSVKNNKGLQAQLKQDREAFKLRTENYQKEAENFKKVQEKQDWKYQDDKGRWRWKEGAEEHGGGTKGTFATAPEKELEPAAKELGKSGEELTESQKQLQSSAEAASDSLMRTGQQMQAVGQIAGIAAAGCFLLSNALEQNGKSKAAKVFKILGTTLSVLSGVFMVLGTVAQMTALQIEASAAEASTAIMNIPIIGWIAAVIAGLIALTLIIVELVETAEERAERLQKETETAKNIANEASDAYDRLLSARDGYKDLLDQLHGLTKGTTEYKDAVAKLNEEVITLANEYPNLEYTFDTETGALKISEESWDKAVKGAYARKNMTSAAAGMTAAYGTIAQDRVDIDKWMKETSNSGSWIRDAGEWFGHFAYNVISTIGAAGSGADASYVDELWSENLDYETAIIEKLTDEEKIKIKTYLTQNRFNEIIKQNQDGIYTDVNGAVNDLRQEIAKFGDLPIFQASEKQLQTTAFSLTNQSEEALILSQAHDVDYYTNIRKKATRNQESYGEWNKKDFGNTSTIDSNRNNWQVIIDYGLDQGLISDIEAYQFGQWNFENDSTLRQAYAAFTGQTLEAVKEIDMSTIENYMGSIYEIIAMGDQLNKEVTQLENLNDKELAKAWKTYKTDSKKLTKAQKDHLLKNLDTLKQVFPDIEDSYWDDLTSGLDTIKFREIGINPKYQTKEIESNWVKNRDFGEDISGAYTTLINEVVESGLEEEKIQSIISMINSSDITSLTSLWKGLKLLEEKGIDLQNIAPDIYNAYVDYIKILERNGIALEKLARDEAKEKFVNLNTTRKSLKDNRNISADQFNNLKDYLENTEFSAELNNFVENEDGTYTYYGELDNISSILTGISDKIPQEQIDQVKASAQMSSFFDWYKNNVTWPEEPSQGYERYFNLRPALYKFLNDAMTSEPDYWNEKSKTWVINIPAGSQASQALDGRSGEMVFRQQENGNFKLLQKDEDGIYTELLSTFDLDPKNLPAQFYNLVMSGLLRSGDENFLETLSQLGLPYHLSRDNADFDTIISLFQQLWNTTPEENEKNVIEAEKISLIGADNNTLAGIVHAYDDGEGSRGEGQENYYEKLDYHRETLDLADKMLDTRAAEDEGALGYFSSWYNSTYGGEELGDLEGSIELDVEDISSDLQALALNLTEIDKKIDSCREDLKDTVKELKNAKKGSEEWRKAAGKIQKIIKDTFGVNIDFDKLEEGSEIIQDWLDGTEGSLKRLGDFLTEGMEITDANGEDLTKQAQNIINQAIDSVDTEGNPVPIVFDADTDSLGAVDATTKAAMDAMAAAYGVSLVWEPGAPYTDTGAPSWYLRAAGVSGSAFSGGGGRKSGGGGGGSKPWENPYDKYHNLLQKIDELLRQRNDLERQYNKLLENRHTTIAELLKNTRENVANLEKEIAAQQRLQKGRREQLRNLANGDYYFDDKGTRRSFASQAAKFGINLSDYVKYNEGTQQIEIDWDAFEEVERRSEKDEKWAEIGKFLQKYYDQIKELSGSYEETQDKIEEMQDAIDEIRGRSKEEYLDFEQKLYDAIVDHIQQYIDAEQELSDTITDAENKILENLRESIDLERQIRDNTKTEEDIADKENRLAYLQRDTTGANALEIQQLQKEIDEAREQYQDTLVDQELERLTRASEEAAEQREHQIELMQEQLDWAEKAGYFWEQVESMIQASFVNQSTTQIEELLSGISEFNVPSAFGAVKWKDDLVAEFLKASEGRANWELDRAKENNTSQKTAITASGKEGNSKIWWDTEKGQWVDAKGNTYTGVGYDVSTHTWKYEGRSDRVQEELDQGEKPPSGKPEPTGGKKYTSTKSYGGFSATASSDVSQAEADRLANNAAIDKYIAQQNESIAETKEKLAAAQTKLAALKKNYEYAKHYGANATQLAAIQKDIDSTSAAASGWQLAIAGYASLIAVAKGKKYKTGGLNTITGPAWLDGTPSKPEYVLNADQTAAFLQLTDVLPSIMSGSLSSEAAPTSVMIDVDINVDSISSDYDVDRLADRLKEDIYNDMMYRNVNVVSLRR